MKGKKMENLWDKISLTSCKWSSLNAPSTETPVSHSLLSESLFSFSVPLSGVIRNWTPQYEDCKVGKLFGQNQLTRLQMVQFECPRGRDPYNVYLLPFQYIGNWFTQLTTPAFFQPEGTSCQRAQYGLNKAKDLR